MYARVARFEGIDASKIDEDVADMKRQMDAGRSGQLPADAPEEARELMETVARWVQLVDRDAGKAIGIAFSATEDKCGGQMRFSMPCRPRQEQDAGRVLPRSMRS
jgi:hypothetical protein